MEKKKHHLGNSDIADSFEHLEEIEVYEWSSHEGGKRLFKTSRRTNIFFLHSTATNYANDETEEKE
jgi:hypothetical protein